MGFSLLSDKAGAAKINHTNALLNVSGVIKLHKSGILSVGLNGGADATSAQFTNLTWGSQFDGNTINAEKPSGEEARYRQFTTTDIGAGIAYQYASVISDQDHDDLTLLKISFGAFHLNRPNQEYWTGSQYRLPVRYTINVSAIHDFKDTRFTLQPSFLISKQYQAWQYVTGSFVKYRTRVGTKVSGLKTENAIGIGIFYRSHDSFIYKLSYEMSDFAVGLSYDVNTSGYRTASKMLGGFEVSLRYNILSGSLFDARNEFK